ncbi:MAG TPA: WD40 repeat domain-containing protein, partial [Pedobacter sp.]
MYKFFFFLLIQFIMVSGYAQTGNIIVPVGNYKNVEKIICDKQNKYIYTAESEKIVMWDVKTHDQLYTFPTGGAEIEGFEVSNDGNTLAFVLHGSLICFSTITGERLFNTRGGRYSSLKFSLDSKKIYLGKDGIVEVDIATHKETVVMKLNFDGFESGIEVLDADHILLYNLYGWQVWNIIDKHLDFEFKYEKKASSSSYLPNLKCIAAYVNGEGIKFRDIFSAKLIGSVAVPDYMYVIIPSVDNKDFIVGKNSVIHRTSIRYSGESFKPLNDVTHSFSGYYRGKENILYAPYMSEGIRIVEARQNKIIGNFERKVSEYVGSTFSFNPKTGLVHTLVDDSQYKSIDLNTLKPYRHLPLDVYTPNMGYSVTGDTIALFDQHYNKHTLRNGISGKILKTIKLPGDAEMLTGGLVFFSTDNKTLYYPAYSQSKKEITLNRLNVQTGISEKIFTNSSFNSYYVHPGKRLVGSVDVGSSYCRAQVRDVTTGKLLFNLDIKDYSNNKEISISDDGKKVELLTRSTSGEYLAVGLLASKSTSEIYDLKTGLLISKSTVFFYTGSCDIRSTSNLPITYVGLNDGTISAVNHLGEIIYSRKKAHPDISDIYLSANEELLYSRSQDDIKIWKAKSGKLLGTLYLFKHGNEFVFLHPSGRFDGTDGGMKQLYYYKNRHKVTLDVIFERFYTPNLYQRLLNG